MTAGAPLDGTVPRAPLDGTVGTSPHGRLEASSISLSFGGLLALDEVSLVAEPGRVTALIGPNGAGKTTLFGCLTGLLTPDRGTVRLDGRDIAGLPPHTRARQGVARTFQRLAVFDRMTVHENLLVAAEAQVRMSLVRELLFRRHRPLLAAAQRVTEVTELLGLGPVLGEQAGTLPTGTLRLVDVGRALCTGPSVLLLDEPASGLDDDETAGLRDVLTGLAGTGLAILIVEHDIDLVREVADAVYVLDGGRLLATGDVESVWRNAVARAAYLGDG